MKPAATMRSSLCAALTALCLSTSAATAGQSADPDIAFIASAGRWETAAESGSYRVLVRQQGYEHVSSAVVAEWVAAPDHARGVSRVRFTRQLVAPGMTSFGRPKLTPHGDRVRVELKGTHTYALNDVACIFELAPGGEVTTVESCG